DEIGDAAGDVVARDPLVQRTGADRDAERINARQIHDLILLATVPVVAFLAVHRHAGPVADTLMRTGQRVEQRGLAAVRIADDGDPRPGRYGRNGHGAPFSLDRQRSTATAAASPRRSDSAKPRTRT